MHNQDWEFLVGESRHTVIYGNPESEKSTGVFLIFYCYVLQLSVFQVPFKTKRDEQLLCVFPASPGLPGPLLKSSLFFRRKAKQSDNGGRESELELVSGSLYHRPALATKQPGALGRPHPLMTLLGLTFFLLGNRSFEVESEAFCESTQSAKWQVTSGPAPEPGKIMRILS